MDVWRASCPFLIPFCYSLFCASHERHERQLAAQQATPEAREEFERNGKACKLTSIVLILLILFVLIPTSTMPVVPVSYLEFTLEAVCLFIPYHYVANFLGVAFQPDCLRVEIEAISGRNY